MKYEECMVCIIDGVVFVVCDIGGDGVLFVFLYGWL